MSEQNRNKKINKIRPETKRLCRVYRSPLTTASAAVVPLAHPRLTNNPRDVLP